MNILISPIDGKEIDIDSMSRKQLRDLHYQEEIRMAELIRSYPPFSEKRRKLLHEGYAFVESLKLVYEEVGQGSFGASNASVQLVCSLLQDGDQGSAKVVYEAGVGLGFAAKVIADIPNVQFCGCDVEILPVIRDILNTHSDMRVNEDTLYNDLMKMPDGSIDLFYADNVIEHMIPDEIPATFKLLYRKMKRGGKLVLMIPNRYTGPHDVTQYYLSKGHRATGFHFMELTYAEGISLGIKNGFWPSYIVKQNGNMLCVKKDYLLLKNSMRILKEFLYSKVNNVSIRQELLSTDVFGAYVFQKK